MRKLLILLVGLWLAGCGSTDSIGAIAVAGDPSPVIRSGSLVGKLSLGVDVANATVTLQALDGATLAETTTDGTGNFYLLDQAVPADCRLVARPAGSDHVFAVEIRSFEPANRSFFRINIPTTLVSQHLRAKPGLSLAEAEDRVKRSLGIPPVYDLQYGVEEATSSPFSHVACWRRAARSGGWGAFNTQLNQAVEQGTTQTFLLTPTEIVTPIAGSLEPALQTIAEAGRARQMLVNDLQPATAGTLPRLEWDDAALLATADSDSSFLTGVSQGVLGNVLTGGLLKPLLGWAVNAMGFNVGTGGQLKQISQQLSEIQAELVVLQQKFTQTTVAQEFNTVQTAANAIQTLSQNLTQQLNTQVSLGPPTSPALAGPGNPTFGLFSSITAANVQGNINTIQQGMAGGANVTNLILTSTNATMGNVGLDLPGNQLYAPIRSEYLLKRLIKPYATFSNAQVLGMMLLSEQMHLPSETLPNLAQNIVDGITPFLTNTQQLKSQRAQLPPPVPSTQIIVDLEFGIMWQAQIQSPATLQQALTYANSSVIQAHLPDGTAMNISDWRLPTFQEFQALQLRGVYNPNKDASVPVINGGVPAVGDYGGATQGLTTLGFTDANVSFNTEPKTTPSPSQNGPNGDLWLNAPITQASPNIKVTYQNAPSHPPSTDGIDFRLNHQGDSFNRDNLQWTGGPGDLNPFVLCRSLGPPVLADTLDGSDQAFPGQPPNPVPSPLAVPALLPGEFVAYGTVTSISNVRLGPAVTPSPAVAAPSPSPDTPAPLPFFIPPGGSQVNCDLTYTLFVGDARVTCGTKDKNTTVSVPAPNPSQQQSTVSVANSNGTLNGLLARYVLFTSSNPNSLRVMNVPGQDGLAIPYLADAVTITAQLLGVNLAPVRGTLTVTPSPPTMPSPVPPGASPLPGASPTVTLQSVLITPRNLQYTPSSQPNSTNGAVNLFLTGFYNNFTVGSLASYATWSVTPVDAAQRLNVILTPNPGNVLNPASLTMKAPPVPNPSPVNLLVQASVTVGNVTAVDNMTIQILPPQQGAPVVTSLIPPSAALTGGTNITIAGSNFTGVTNVTFGGVPATSFTVVTSSQITATVPPGAGAGPVSLNVISPDGTGTATFTYTTAP